MSAVEDLITTPDRALLEVPVGDIIPSPDNRKNMGNLEALAVSIGDRGVLVPLIVAPHPKHAGRWDLIAGERRLRASIMAGLDTVPCIVRRLAPAERDEDRLVENLHRKDLDPVEEAAGYQLLVDRHGYTQTQVAERLGKSQGHVSKRLSLLRLPDAVLDELRPHDAPDAGDGEDQDVDDRKLTLEDAYALVPLADHPDRILEAMHGFAPGDSYKTSVANAVRRHVTEIEWAAMRAESLETLQRRKVRVVEPDQLPVSVYAVKGLTGVTPLGLDRGGLAVAVGVHARHHADHHVAVVLVSGEIVYGCDQPRDHDQAAKANGKLSGDQLHLVPEAAEDDARRKADEAAYNAAVSTRRKAAAELVAAATRPGLGDTIVRTLPAILDAVQEQRLKVACRILDLDPDAHANAAAHDHNGRVGALLAHAAGDPHASAQVLLAVMVAVTEDLATGWGRNRWGQMPATAPYLEWLRDGGVVLTDIEQRALDQQAGP